MRNNLFTSFLENLKVPFTREYTTKYYREHPYRDNLYGLSQMLSDYRIENAGIRLQGEDKDITKIDTPVIAHLSSDFVIVEKATSENVSCIWKNRKVTIPTVEFHKYWDGVILLAEPSMDSIEPNYNDNKKKAFFHKAQIIMLLLIAMIIVVALILNNGIYAQIWLSLLLAINLAGVYVGYLLIKKQVNIRSDIADKICSLFKKSDCNDILQSPAAKFMGIIGWSEVGLGYFLSNVIVILAFPPLMPYLALINIAALPYTVWSIWYQKFRADQWCPLCLIVQLLLWLVFAVNLLGGLISISSFNYTEILLIGCIYLAPFLTINLLLPSIVDSLHSSGSRHELNALRMKDEVFEAMLKGQPHYDVNFDTSKILFGNKNAGVLVTILTNPHCAPCGRMHARVEKLLPELGDKLCVQYVFSSFSPQYEDSNKLLISAYLDYHDSVNSIYAEWYGGSSAKEAIRLKYNLHTDSAGITEEFERHEAWRKETGLQATPTILINGYKLPEIYKIEDLKYFTDLLVNIE